MILAVVISAVFFFIWYTVINPSQNTPGQQKNVVQTEDAASANSVAGSEKANETVTAEKKDTPAANAVVDPNASLPVKTWKASNDLVEVEFTSDGAMPISWKINGYNSTVEKNSPLIDLVAEKVTSKGPMALSFSDANFSFPERPKYELVDSGGNYAAFRWRSKEVEIEKKITIDKNNYLADVEVSIRNLMDAAIETRPALIWTGLNLPADEGGFFGIGKQQPLNSVLPIYYLEGKANREGNISKLKPTDIKEGGVYWSGLESRYFFDSVIPRQQADGSAAFFGFERTEDMKKGEALLFAGTMLKKIVVPRGGETKVSFTTYVGPKDINKLKAAGIHLDEAIDYGWFTVIALPILYLLRFFYGIIHNYGVAIILLTIFVKLLLHPINVKSLKSMKEMQKLQPQMKEIQAKYKDDKQRINVETMQLFRAHKVNPMGGCLPMLLQFPIYIALYKVLWNSIELYHAPFFWFYRDLSAPDPYFITPILLGIFMVAQQMLTPSASADPTQKKMMLMMPIMFSVFMLFLPVGLVVYILVNTVMSVTQQWMYNKGIGFMDVVRGRWKTCCA
jgi:YidC/Oxa1 family membrane protein insertase